MQTLIELISGVVEKAGEDVSIHPAYSGKGMYGKTCLGLSGPVENVREMIGQIYAEILEQAFDVAMDGDEESANEAHDSAQVMISQLSEYQVDSLGNDIIHYWPNIKGDSGDER